eukprot:5535704-Amphidinium_carterae.1
MFSPIKKKSDLQHQDSNLIPSVWDQTEVWKNQNEPWVRGPSPGPHPPSGLIRARTAPSDPELSKAERECRHRVIKGTDDPRLQEPRFRTGT